MPAAPLDPLVGAMPSRQGGIALFICLVVLLVLGVAGTSASQTVSLEARMARNSHDGELALQAAESALREAERLLVSGGFDPDTPGFHESAAFGTPKPWTLAEAWRDTGSRVATSLAGVAEPPRFIVERIASGVESGGMEVFRVTARAVGGTRHARVMLQSTFAPAAGRTSWRELEPLESR